VIVHTGLLLVYCDAESAGAFAIFQVPSWDVSPAILIVSPTEVAILCVKVTATAVGHAVVPVVVLVVRVVVVSVVDGGTDELPDTKTTGSPFLRPTQRFPLPSDV
jgi:hypothetical protein